MVLDESMIREVLKRFSIGRFCRMVEALDSGFQSDNYHIQTTTGDYVVRVIHDTVENVEYSMRVHEYLADRMIKTPRPARTREGALSLEHKGAVFAVQSFVPGRDVGSSLDAIDPLLPFYGRELGEIHRVSLHMVEKLGEERLTGRQDCISYVHEAARMYLPENDYILHQFSVWEKEIETLSHSGLTRAVIHGDVGPKDFFFKDGDYVGILDFNAAHLDYLLFDIAPMMMYCELMSTERARQYASFMTNYLGTSPVERNELRYLDLILRTRSLMQILYHQYRYMEGIVQGQNTANVEENLKGIVDGERFLRLTSRHDREYFYRLCEEPRAV